DYVETIKVLLEIGVDPRARDNKGIPPLNEFCGTGEPDAFIHSSIVKLLLDAGADVTDMDTRSGMTALHYAVIYGFCSTAHELIKRGADIEARDHGG
ncbi:ankyrin repeat-containing domain protein, partial [Baffinella frigidus]